MRAVTALSLIKDTVSNGEASDRNLVKPSKGEYINPIPNSNLSNPYNLKGPHYNNCERTYERKKETIHQAMTICRSSGQSVKVSKTCQPALIDYEGLPWPLSVPWSGSFLTSSNPTRDFPRHGVYALIEKHIVSLYREEMIQSTPEIGVLRSDISCVLTKYLPDGTYTFADNIQTPELYETRRFTELETVLHCDRLSKSFSNYNNQVEEIIKCVAKQTVLLANPFGDEDSYLVRGAFESFVDVSLSFRWKESANIIHSFLGSNK